MEDHALMFVGPGMLSWFIVTQIVVGSLFNNHMFDFTEGWVYVCGIGVFGGTCLRQADASASFGRGLT